MFRRTLDGIANDAVRRSLRQEALAQSMVFASHDYAELRAARAEQREPKYRGR
jgi:enoyl-CoA hydratase